MKITAQGKAIAEPHIDKAREYLKNRNWTKSWRLAKEIGISSQIAGKVLAYLPEWEPWNPNAKNRRFRLWKRVSE
jgi:ribosomal protein S25